MEDKDYSKILDIIETYCFDESVPKLNTERPDNSELCGLDVSQFVIYYYKNSFRC